MSGMNAQQLHDYFIKPTLKYMGGNYYSKEASFLLLCTSAIESNCGEYVSQVGSGIAKGIWQMEDSTHNDVWVNCDAIKKPRFKQHMLHLTIKKSPLNIHKNQIISPMYACAMARLKYSMDSAPLPKLTNDAEIDMQSFYKYYKRVYNTELGASTYVKWARSLNANKILEVEL